MNTTMSNYTRVLVIGSVVIAVVCSVMVANKKSHTLSSERWTLTTLAGTQTVMNAEMWGNGDTVTFITMDGQQGRATAPYTLISCTPATGPEK